MEGPGRERGRGEKSRSRIRYWKGQERSTEGQEIEWRCVAVGDGELRVAKRKVPDTRNARGSQDPTRMKYPTKGRENL